MDWKASDTLAASKQKRIQASSIPFGILASSREGLGSERVREVQSKALLKLRCTMLRERWRKAGLTLAYDASHRSAAQSAFDFAVLFGGAVSFGRVGVAKCVEPSYSRCPP